MTLNKTNKNFLSFSRRLFLSVIALFLVFAFCFIAFQYQREKGYKVQLLHRSSQDYNSRLMQHLDSCSGFTELTNFIKHSENTGELRLCVTSPVCLLVSSKYDPVTQIS